MERMLSEKKKPNQGLALRCAALTAGYYMLFYTVNVMTGSYLLSFGYSAAFVANMMSVSGAVALAAKLLFTGVIERGRCRALAFSYLACIVAGSCLLFLTGGKPAAAVVGYVVLAQAAVGCFMELLDTWMLKLIKQNKGLDYGRIRAFGSASFAAASLSYGWAVTRFGYGIALWVILALLACCFLAALTVPDPAREDTNARQRAKLIDFSGYAVLLRDRRFLAFLCCGMFVNFCWTISDTFITVYIYDLGGTPAQAGLSSCIMALIEVVVFRIFSRLADRVGTDRILAFGMLGYGLKALAVSFMTTPTTVILACTLQAVALGLYLPGKMRFIEREFPQQQIASAMSLCSLVVSVSTTFAANPIAAKIVDAWGSGRLLLILGVISLMAGSAFLLLIRRLGPKLQPEQTPAA